MAKETKKGFVLYYDYRDHLAILTDEERGRLLMALLEYGQTHTEPELDGAALMAFSFIRCQIDRDAAKYAETCRKRSEAGSRGGRPPKANAPEDETKKASAFSENQTGAKKPDTNTNKETNTNTNKDTNTNTGTTTPIPPKGGEPDGAPAAADPTPYKAIVALYHDLCPSYPKLRNVSDNRKKAMAARWKEYGHDLDTFRELFEQAEASQFLKGKNPRNWTADFDWLMKSASMAKVLEGNYDQDKMNGGQRHGEHSGNFERRDGRESSLSGFRMADA